ncbi:hypothetical protein BKA57DRAFT_479357 [Linnemannia elongata]|nr:hypothetical protein BKA57DRAFT_479357 [Linnemannia elongata]
MLLSLYLLTPFFIDMLLALHPFTLLCVHLPTCPCILLSCFRSYPCLSLWFPFSSFCNKKQLNLAISRMFFLLTLHFLLLQLIFGSEPGRKVLRNKKKNVRVV